MINSGIRPVILIGIFLLKVSVGIANGWLMQRYFNGGDTWHYHAEALKEYRLLFQAPKEYLVNIFHSSYQAGYSGWFDSANSYWNDLKLNLVIKLLSVFDIFSGGDYYTNAIFFNFIVLFGNVALYKVFAAIYKDKQNILLISCFLLPSFLLFTSAVHKEGLISSALGIALYIIYNSFSKKRIHITGIMMLVFCLLYILLQRNFVFLALLPAFIAWFLTTTKQWPPLKTFAIVYSIVVIIFFTIWMISPSLDLPTYVVAKQTSFFELKNARTAIVTDTLHPNFISFLHNAPQAFDHGIIRPYITEVSALPLLFPFAIETSVYIFLFFLYIFCKKQSPVVLKNDKAFILTGIFFSLSLIMIIGYTIPITGAIVRYRSIYFPFLLSPILCSIDWNWLLRKTN
jgi:hypothetical protein